MKFSKHIGLVLKGINPNKLAEVIYKAYIIFFLPTDSGAGPQTSENTSSKGTVDTLTEVG